MSELQSTNKSLNTIFLLAGGFIVVYCACDFSPLRFVVARSEFPNDAVNVLTACVTNPALVIPLFKVYRKLSLMMFAIRAGKKIFAVRAVRCSKNVR